MDDPLWMEVEGGIMAALEELYKEFGGTVEIGTDQENGVDGVIVLSVEGRGTVQVRVDVVGVDPHRG